MSTSRSGTVTITDQIVSDPDHSKALSVSPTKRPRSKSTIGLHPATVAALKRRKSQQAADRLVMGRGWPKIGCGGRSRLHMEGRDTDPPEEVESNHRASVGGRQTPPYHRARTAAQLCHGRTGGPSPRRDCGRPSRQYAAHGARVTRTSSRPTTPALRIWSVISTGNRKKRNGEFL